MRQRITFVHPQGAGVDPVALSISPTQLQGPSTQAVREDRLTFDLDELPANLVGLLPRLRRLAVRWASASTHDTLEPFNSRISPGLHVSYALIDVDDAEAR